jgi:cephalosporin hydroxylase
MDHAESVVNAFHDLYYTSPSRTWQNTFWMGVPVAKCPLDLWIFQEIFWEVRPTLIVECGTFLGGSALFFASMCDLLCHGHVLTIDIENRPNRPRHPRITYLTGSSTSPETIQAVFHAAKHSQPVMVNLDSDHHVNHVLQEMEFYARFVSPGSYLIVEDGNINGHPVSRDFGPGPMEAICEFLRHHPEFAPDRRREKFFLTFNPLGYLRRM